MAFHRRLPAALGICLGLAGMLSFALTSAGQPLDVAHFTEMRWRMIGPFRGGRTVAVSGVPGQPNVFYMAPNNGGVWKSTDYGRVWTPIFDNQPTGSIGALAVAPSDPNVLYVGSGEGLQRPDLSVGDGIYKSDGRGKELAPPGSRRRPADRRDPRGPEGREATLRRGPRPPLRTQRRARRLSLGRRRRDLAEGPLQG